MQRGKKARKHTCSQFPLAPGLLWVGQLHCPRGISLKESQFLGLCNTTLLTDEGKEPGFRRSPGSSGGFSFPTSINISASARAKLLSASTLGMGAPTFVCPTLTLCALTLKKVTLSTAFSPDRLPHLNGRDGLRTCQFHLSTPQTGVPMP